VLPCHRGNAGERAREQRAISSEKQDRSLRSSVSCGADGFVREMTGGWPERWAIYCVLNERCSAVGEGLENTFRYAHAAVRVDIETAAAVIPGGADDHVVNGLVAIHEHAVRQSATFDGDAW
jgi:hypothetical protein